MKKGRKKNSKGREESPLLDRMHKPATPPGHPLTRAKPEDRAHPAERKAKHKRRPADGD